MCLYPKLIKNKKYLPNKKNGGKPPPCPDERLLFVTAACGECMECRKQKSRQWLVRMCEELRTEPNAYFISLTIDDNSYAKLKADTDTGEDNEIATIAIRRCLERIRRETKKSIKHWFTTELGHNNTERLHLHGITWGIGTDELIKKKWQYGFVYIGNFVNEKTINYITKYMTKVDEEHKGFSGKVLCSAGLGEGYTKRVDAETNKYKGERTNESYRLRNGTRLNLPIYYRNKLLSEEEREALWLNKLDKGDVYVMGQKIKIDDTENYENLMQWYREQANRLGYKKREDWEKDKYYKRLQRQRKAQKKALDELKKTFEDRDFKENCKELPF